MGAAFAEAFVEEWGDNFPFDVVVNLSEIKLKELHAGVEVHVGSFCV